MSLLGQEVAVTVETVYVLPLKYKSQMQATLNGVNIDAVQGCDGDKGWMVTMGMTIDLPAAALQALKDEAYVAEVEMLVPLLTNKAYTLASLAEIKVNGKAAEGVKVSAKGHKDIELYFDKATSMPVMNEAKYEVTYSDFKELGGVKHPTKAVVLMDGKNFMEMEVTDVKPLDKVDDKEFAKPQRIGAGAWPALLSLILPSGRGGVAGLLCGVSRGQCVRGVIRLSA
jgi:hypothetical protein